MFLLKRSEQMNVLFWYDLFLRFGARKSVFLRKSFLSKLRSREIEKSFADFT